MTTKELKALFKDLAEQADNYEDLISYVRSYVSEGEISEDDYDFILEHWDEWLED